MKKQYILLIVLLLNTGLAITQVGIGNPNPDSTSTLDLSNPNNRGLKLPEVTSPAAMSLSEKMLYYYQGNIYFRTSLGYNGLSPWKYRFNGNIAEDVYYNLSGNIGIGSTNITTSPLAKLHIETDNPISLTNNGSFMIGSILGTNIAFNGNEIQSRNAGSDAPLTINEDGGNVVFGSSASPSSVQTTGTVQQYNQGTGTYYDLVPTGSVLMWYGTTTNVPEGWAICDGGTYPFSDGSGTLVAPDLSGKFVVSVGNNGTTNYVPGETGGEDSVTLSIDEIPSHDHNVTDLGHTHGYTDKYQNNQISDDANDRDVADDSETTENKTTNTGFANISEDAVGGGSAHENRPSFYALVYIIKL